MADNRLQHVLRTRLESREAAAERHFWEAGEVLRQELGVDPELWRRIVQRVGRPLTWRIWEIAIEELR